MIIPKNGIFRFKIQSKKVAYQKTFYSLKEAEEHRDKVIAKLMKDRIEFKTKEELDKYLEIN